MQYGGGVLDIITYSALGYSALLANLQVTLERLDAYASRAPPETGGVVSPSETPIINIAIAILRHSHDQSAQAGDSVLGFHEFGLV